MAGVAKQIIGSFEDIGKDIAREAAQVPKDVIGKAIESLGTSTKKGQPPLRQGSAGQAAVEAPKQPEKPMPPREWLAELAGKNKPQKEPTVQERLEREEFEKKEAVKKQQSMQMAPLANVSTKQKRGNLYAVKQKSTAVENKNSRQD